MSSDYTINEHGIIQDLGKFEAEPAYAPYFWDFVLGGSSSETLYDNDRPVDVFIVDAEDVAKFPVLQDVYAVVIWETDQGFVNTREMTERQLDAYRAELENAEPTEPQKDDLTTEDHETFYQNGKIVLRAIDGPTGEYWEYRDYSHMDANGIRSGVRYLPLGRFATVEQAIKAYMVKTQFWPNVWFISGHGNAHLIDLTEGK